MDTPDFSLRTQIYFFVGMAATLITILLVPAIRANMVLVLPQLLIVTALSIAPYLISTDLWSPTLRKFLSFSLGAALPLWSWLLLMADIWVVASVTIAALSVAVGFVFWQHYSTARMTIFQKLVPVVLLQLVSLQLVLFRQVTLNFLKSTFTNKG